VKEVIEVSEGIGRPGEIAAPRRRILPVRKCV